MYRIHSLSTGIVIAAGLTLATVASAVAEDRNGYSVSDVVAHFSPPADLGPARRLCIGTPSECGAPEPAAVTPFNLRVQFEFNSSELTPSAQAQLDVFAEAATGALSAQRFNIDGHTDATGSERANQWLSEQRAAAVVDYLVVRGVEVERLAPAGHGESAPALDNPFDGANRRVEATLAQTL